jgi:hypothetical protein
LLVFASGGGRGDSWGGQKWRDASPEYKALVDKYHLIDLYDGRHPHMGPRERHGGDDIVRAVQTAVRERAHQALVFHDVGERSLIDFAKGILYPSADHTLTRETFEKSMTFLRDMQNVVWIAPAGDVLKYEAERKSASLSVLARSAQELRLTLTVGTDRDLYDHPLTLVIPNTGKREVKSIVQGDRRIEGYTVAENGLRFDVSPVSGPIDILFR